MKRIGILTFNKVLNYGAFLQMYALQKKLELYKYDVAIIDYKNDVLKKNYRLFNIDTTSIRRFFKSIFSSLIFIKKNYKRRKAFMNIYNKTIRHSIEYDSNEVNYDVLITGSDQVWNPKITGGLDDVYFLNFGNENVKRISYAASCGSISSIDKCKNEFKDKIAKINCISVRENNLKEYIENEFKLESTVVVDPTILLTKKEWESFLIKDKPIREKYIFAYSVGNANQLFYDTVNELAKKTGYLIVFFDKNDLKNNFKYRKKSLFECGPDEFINLLYYSEYVVTTSFHGFALSTIFNKEMLVVLGTYPDRLVSLTNMLELQNRIITDIKELENIQKNSIDWNNVNQKLDVERTKSSKWLIKSIEE
jgi:hypothetical protein